MRLLLVSGANCFFGSDLKQSVRNAVPVLAGFTWQVAVVMLTGCLNTGSGVGGGWTELLGIVLVPVSSTRPGHPGNE